MFRLSPAAPMLTGRLSRAGLAATAGTASMCASAGGSATAVRHLTNDPDAAISHSYTSSDDDGTELVAVDDDGPVRVVTILRAERRNAVDGKTAQALAAAFRDFEADDAAAVAILTGEGDHFCAGADLKALSADAGAANVLDDDMSADGPMGPTRMLLSKPVIAAVEGYCVAGGLELACWADLRVAAEDATFGVFCRRYGVPLIDGGTVRLPRLIGQSRALDMILTGRAVGAAEAKDMGLVNRVVGSGEALGAAIELGHLIAAFPQVCLRNDRMSAYMQWNHESIEDALAEEFDLGLDSIGSGGAVEGATRFTTGEGKHGSFDAFGKSRL